MQELVAVDTTIQGIQIIDVMLYRDGIDNLYDIEEIKFNGSVYLVSELLGTSDKKILPNNFTLYAPYPNPFNPTVSLDFDIPKKQHIQISIYDLNGRLVHTLFDNLLAAGSYTKSWNAKDKLGMEVSNGVYFVYFNAGSFSQKEKILYLK